MLNPAARILLTFTALVPVGLTYSWVAYREGDCENAFRILLVCTGSLLACLLVLTRAQTQLPVSSFKAKSIEASDHENTAFLIIYIMPLFTNKINTLDRNFWIPTLIIFAVITATGYNYHFNPLLGLLGWHFYRVESEEGVKYVLITKKQLRTASKTIMIGQLTEYILLDVGER